MDSTTLPLTVEGNSRILELNYHILPQIYSWIMPYEMLDGSLKSGSGSLSALMCGTHVCRLWRNILLDSPLLWAQCLNFTVLQHKDAYLLDTVISRSKNSPMTITGNITSIRPGDIGWYLLDILQIHWGKIRNVRLSVQITGHSHGVRWADAMASILWRPAHEMRHFSLHVQLPPYEGRRRVPIIPLFSQHAPTLRLLSLSVPRTTLPVSITAGHSNLRTIHLSREDQTITDNELLAMCMHVPMLERLTLTLYTVKMTDTCLLPNLPRLTFIEIKSHDLTIYPAFLERIHPNDACNLRLTNNHIKWENINTDLIVDTVDAALNTLRRYMDLLFSSQDKVLPDIRIRVTQGRLLITSSDPYSIEIQWMLPKNCDPPIFCRCFQVIFTNLSVATYPRQVTLLDLFHGITDLRCLPDSYYLMGLLTSMRTITSLAINIKCLLYIQKAVTDADLLPCLETLILHGEGEIEDIMPFLMQRHRTIPIQRLDLTGSDQGLIEYACPLLDVVHGLELVWFPDFAGRKETYVCGSGGLQYAKRAPYYVRHMA